jgi:hypothetical protein
VNIHLLILRYDTIRSEFRGPALRTWLAQLSVYEKALRLASNSIPIDRLVTTLTGRVFEAVHSERELRRVSENLTWIMHHLLFSSPLGAISLALLPRRHGTLTRRSSVAPAILGSTLRVGMHFLLLTFWNLLLVGFHCPVRI